MFLESTLSITSRAMLRACNPWLTKNGFGCQYCTKKLTLPQKKKKQISIKQTVAHTNKLLYGPLLVSSARKKKEIQEQEAIISHPENRPFVENFQDDETESQEILVPELECETSSEISQSIKYKKLLVLRKSLYQSHPPKKIVFNSSQVNTELAESVSSVHSNKETSENFSTAESSVELVAQDDDTCRTVVSRVSEKSEEKTSVDTTSANDDSSLIIVDNSQFAAAPNVFDINMIENFPLYNNILSASERIMVPRTTPVQKDVVTIGIFDDGYKKLPSVRKILEETAPLANKLVLKKWKAKMIKDLGEEGFEQYRKSE